MAAVKRNDPKKRPVPAIEKVEKLEKRPGGKPASATEAPRRGPKPSGKAPPKGRRDDRRDDRRDGGRGEHRRGARPAPTAEAKGPAFIGGPRNEFGTRVARRITCSRCGNVDHVPHAPKDLSRALCRSCAGEVLKTYEVGTRVRETRPCVCTLCQRTFQLPISVELKDDVALCPDCLRGFATWTGGLGSTPEERESVEVEQRLGGTLVRRRKKS
jgi:hypothetical protein